MKSYPAIGIRPIVDSRRMGIRDALEGKVREMAEAAKKLIEENVFYADGTPVKVVIFPGSIAGGEEAARCASYFETQNVVATLSVTPSWCYPLETIDSAVCKMYSRSRTDEEPGLCGNRRSFHGNHGILY